MTRTGDLRKEFRERVVKVVLDASPLFLDVENIRVRSGLKNWESAKAIALELVIEGRLKVVRTSKGFVFGI